MRKHFAADPAFLPSLSASFESHEHPSVHRALENFAAAEGRTAQLIGLRITDFMARDIGLSDLMQSQQTLWGSGSITQGPVEYTSIALPGDTFQSCVQRGLYLVRKGQEAFAILIQVSRQLGSDNSIKVEVMASSKEAAESFLNDLRKSLRQRNVYRGHVLSLSLSEGWPRALTIKCQTLPHVDSDKIILPEDLLQRIERQADGFTRHRDKLLAAGRHLKRGILLHGPPGTGKTLTAMYLAKRTPERTVLLLAGSDLALIGKSCQLARALQPALVILEDVDLVAQERTQPGAACTNTLLFELLNEMDGLSEDADILFLLTTNRPEILEPALSARPGRIDQALEIPLPDLVWRRRLFELYSRGLNLRVDNLESFVRRTKGGSGAFIRELMRRAALFAAEDGPEIIVEEHHLEEAIHEMVVQGKEMTKSLLGFRTTGGPAT